jgi:hypothetical protein
MGNSQRAESLDAAESVGEVLTKLGHCIETARAENTADGYFPLIYSWETRDIAAAAEAFDAPDGMRRMIAAFADRYFTAREQFRAGQATTKTWDLAFRAARSSSALVVQHLLLAMNAHINVDLPIVAAETGIALADYTRVDTILEQGISRIQGALNRTTILLRLLDLVGGDFDEMFAAWSLKAARRHAFELASRLRAAPETERPALIAQADETAFCLGQQLLAPPLRDRLLLAAIRLTEQNKSPRELLALLER